MNKMEHYELCVYYQTRKEEEAAEESCSFSANRPVFSLFHAPKEAFCLINQVVTWKSEEIYSINKSIFWEGKRSRGVSNILPWRPVPNFFGIWSYTRRMSIAFF
jgi:hypothetical protein